MPLVEISTGELVDKITILEIKRERIAHEGQLKNIELELHVLTQALDAEPDLPEEVSKLKDQLREVNETLWDIEDEIRDCERQNEFSEQFVELARAVYRTNDQRAELKREINQVTHSRLVEEKSYSDY